VKILPGLNITRVIWPRRGYDQPSRWLIPYFAVHVGRHWWFPFGDGAQALERRKDRALGKAVDRGWVDEPAETETRRVRGNP